MATGPFTEVDFFGSQAYEVGRNPHYWQPGKPAVQALRFRAYPANEQAILALLNDELDWAGTFLPAIDRVFDGARSGRTTATGSRCSTPPCSCTPTPAARRWTTCACARR